MSLRESICTCWKGTHLELLDVLCVTICEEKEGQDEKEKTVSI